MEQETAVLIRRTRTLHRAMYGVADDPPPNNDRNIAFFVTSDEGRTKNSDITTTS